MGGGRFSWLKPEVYPVLASLGVGVAFCIYSMGRHLITNPEVHLTKSYRMEGVPESGTIEVRAEGYRTSIFQAIQAERAKKSISEGRARIF